MSTIYREISMDRPAQANELVKQWDSVATRYDWSPSEYTYVMPALLNFIGSLSGQRVIELGCGTGVVTEKLIAGGAESVLGVDWSLSMLDILRSRLNDSRIELVHADFCESLEYLSQREFDIAVFAFSFEQIPSYDEALRVLRAISRISGTTFILLPTPVEDLRQEGDIERRQVIRYGHEWIEINITTHLNQQATFLQPKWSEGVLRDIFNHAGLKYDWVRVDVPVQSGESIAPCYSLIKLESDMTYARP